MSAVKKYLKKEFQIPRFGLEHRPASDFYLWFWQRNKSTFLLLLFRCFLFTGCLAIVIASMVLTARSMSIGYWFIYMTHWGLAMITVTSGFSVAVCYIAHFVGPIDATFNLPWFIKVYWILCNISTTLAFFITIYYYIFLTGAYEDFSVDPVLDVFIHAINSVLMLLLVVTSRQPSHMLHFYHPLVFGVVYLLFSVLYYIAGGSDPFGNAYIYPTLDWGNEPVMASLSVLVSAVALVLIHAIVVGIVVLRRTLTTRLFSKRRSQNLHT